MNRNRERAQQAELDRRVKPQQVESPKPQITTVSEPVVVDVVGEPEQEVTEKVAKKVTKKVSKKKVSKKKAGV